MGSSFGLSGFPLSSFLSLSLSFLESLSFLGARLFVDSSASFGTVVTRITVRVTVVGRARLARATGTGRRCCDVGATATGVSTTGADVIDGAGSAAPTGSATGAATCTGGVPEALGELSAPVSSTIPATTDAASDANAPAEISRRARGPSSGRRAAVGRARRTAATPDAAGRCAGSVAVIRRIAEPSGSGISGGTTGSRCSRAIADSSAPPSNSRRPVTASSSSSPSA